MRNPWEWDENDLLEMVKAGAQESIELDFKRSDSLVSIKGKDIRYEISKDVSALANSAGGTLIYGMIENGHVATGLDAGSDPNVMTKERLQQIIDSNIHRKIDGLRVKQVALATTHPGNVAYVVYVPQSTRTPHQAADKKFYKRHEYESVAMEEYEVRDLYRRSEAPDLRIIFSLRQTELKKSDDGLWSEPFELGVNITNDAFEPANYAVIYIFIDERIKVENTGGLTTHGGNAIALSLGQYPVNMLGLNWSIQSKLPIFNQPIPFSIINNGRRLLLKAPIDEKPENQSPYLLGYQIGAPRMPVKSAFITLRIQDKKITLANTFFTYEELASNYDRHGLWIE